MVYTGERHHSRTSSRVRWLQDLAIDQRVHFVCELGTRVESVGTTLYSLLKMIPNHPNKSLMIHDCVENQRRKITKKATLSATYHTEYREIHHNQKDTHLHLQ